MNNQNVNIEDEIDDLKHELKHFQKEKERVRAIIGKIGGTPKYGTKFINILFIIAVAIPVLISIFAGERVRLLMVELATVILSVKIIYLIHSQMHVNHFEFWILSSIEWRINEMTKLIKKSQKDSDD